MIKKIFIFLLIILAPFFVYKLVSIPNNEIMYDNPDLIFYWGNGCPHCENVEDWLAQNNQDNKIKVN